MQINFTPRPLNNPQLWNALFLTLCFSFCLPFIHAQDSKMNAAHWYFGKGYGLDFTAGEVKFEHNNSMDTYEACCTMSDKNGNLLFYTNGGGREDGVATGYIWNKAHQPMDGGVLGGDKGGGHSAAQGCITFEKPGHSGIYCLFTVDEKETPNYANTNFPQGKGCSYFEIDMNANGGLGRVTVSNQKLLTPAFENIAATKHSNCMDYWVIVTSGHYYVSQDPNSLDTFYVFKVTEQGVQAPLKIPMPEGFPDEADEYGIIKISPDGSRIICGSFLYNFDNANGQISQPLNMEQTFGTQRETPFCFSGNSRFLYAYRQEIFDTVTTLKVVQYDLESASPPAQAVLLGKQGLHGVVVFGSPQLAPDNKIYMLVQQGGYTKPTIVSVIKNPNVKGLAASFQFPLFLITKGTADERFLRFGNFTDHIFAYRPTLPVDIGPDIMLPCNDSPGASLHVPPAYECYLWSTGETTESIHVTDAGTYILEVFKGCEMGVDSVDVIIDKDLEVVLGNDTLLCDDEQLLLSAPPLQNVNYLWQDSSSEHSYLVQQAGIYWLEVSLGNCFGSDSIFINYSYTPTPELPLDTMLCSGESVLLQNTGPTENATYQWSDGSTGNVLLVTEAGQYFLQATNECGTGDAGIKVGFEDCEEEFCNVFVPNVFSPNGDGINDELEVFSNCQFAAYHLQIFNRWGGLLFESHSPDEQWTGQEAEAVGVYVYTLRYQISKGGKLEWEQMSGGVTLVK